jgi:hypothetical protein
VTRPAALVAWAVLLPAAAGCGPGEPKVVVVPHPTPVPAAGHRPAPRPESPAWFRDVTDGSGVNLVYRNGEEADRYTILETLGGGVAVLDYDADGKPDLFFPAGGGFAGPDKRQVVGLPPKLYRNLGDWKFRDVTAAAGLDRLADGAPWFYSHGAVSADYDRDGWPDLLMTGYGRVALWHNEPDGAGGRRFREVTKAAGLLGPHFWSTGAAWGDLDADGYPDLYLCQYVDWSNDNDPACPGYYASVPRDVCPPRQFGARPHALYRNNGDGTFEDVGRSAGLRVDPPDGNKGKGLGVLFVDVDRDGRPDVYVANDTSGNFLYLNKTEPGGPIRLDERGLELGVARDGSGAPTGSMGVDAADWDGCGRPSIWVSNYENEFHALYQNRLPAGRPAFTFDTARAGLGVIGPRFVGFGTAFVDADRDGWEDLVVNNGHVIRHSPRGNVDQPPVFFRNGVKDGRRYFAEAGADAGPFFREARRGRGLAVADLDDDGRPDLVFCYSNEPARLVRNEAPADHHWVGVRLAPAGHADPTGARLTLEVGGRTLTRFATAGRSYLSGCDPRFVLGLGDDKAPGRLTVCWPSGSPRAEYWDGLAPDRYHTLEQGKGRPVEEKP